MTDVRQTAGRADAQVTGARLVLHEAARRIDAAPGEPDTNRAMYRAKLLAGDAASPASSDVCADVVGTTALGLDPVTGTDTRPW